ncbi:40S ribosomal protein S12 [Caerostris extrusa]|uniref:40S ribosomal protein S12 n=1 Tax=Caerostris extrusa TaxID=172846 RepID=A0AAV4WK03_CAEEX|nr:40S ribosomal protein S12 [Caerostris extrusa]
MLYRSVTIKFFVEARVTYFGDIFTKMSDIEVDTTGGGDMDVNTALQEVLKTALTHGKLSRGIHEAAKSLDKRQALLCVLATNCDEPLYLKLVEALCAEHQIHLLKGKFLCNEIAGEKLVGDCQVDSNKRLGEWAGLCTIDKEGKARKVVGCSCVVVVDYGKETQAHDVLNEYFKSKRQ